MGPPSKSRQQSLGYSSVGCCRRGALKTPAAAPRERSGALRTFSTRPPFLTPTRTVIATTASRIHDGPNAPMALALRAWRTRASKPRRSISHGTEAFGPRGIWSRFVNIDNTVAVSLTAGVIMRRRSRHTSTSNESPEWPATTADDAVDAGTQSDAALDDALRALARLLARQAAREIFDRECAQEVKPEDLQ
jgi:hypothetical protein